MALLDSLKWRYATKKFDASKKVDETTLNTILEAGNLSASSYGLQPWKLVVVETKELREELLAHSWGQKQVVDASHLIVIAREANLTADHVNTFADNVKAARNLPEEAIADYRGMMLNTVNSLPDEVKDIWNSKQAYIVLGSLLAACADLKVDSTPMEGFVPEKYDEVLGFDKLGLKSTVILPIGYRAEDDGYQHLAKYRKPLDEVVVKL
ncbi:NAD(P)H-dependent oxidoreductase [Flammeovirga kamogawensis]|uniref:NAD(P)H-dependent oxidoreductase n=1 Tax=Flammeovirga kamogawensis TaxID=373891 RepID=A0ABX8GY39_9BACT|nr:NAD(P)H-dependent oxidoreductase [Flammeovirga kamogawensis]MBB6458954.1 nitroreductase [Flammeovirga kamogawensis]QWG08529.1 NAD(P)H-dependent oxidoreductase [Flammeovirga kamogawensis]TRX66822.1 NAD(P)H-dependent oxidoreductase [Flammeovirga kamogawensis]